jgi:hypothetical protein
MSQPAWSYTNDPSASQEDAVRWLVGDTDPADPKLADGEVSFALTMEGNPTMAAARCAQALQAKYAAKIDKVVGDLQVSFSQKAAAFGALAAELRSRGLQGGIRIKAGGTSVADKETLEANTDVTEPGFKRDMHKTPDTGSRTGPIPWWP